MLNESRLCFLKQVTQSQFKPASGLVESTGASNVFRTGLPQGPSVLRVPLHQLNSQAGISKWWSMLTFYRFRNFSRQKASLPTQLQQKTCSCTSLCWLWSHVLLSTNHCGQRDTQHGLASSDHEFTHRARGVKPIPTKSWAEGTGMVSQGKNGVL